MTMTTTLRNFLASRDVDYREVPHPREFTSSRIAEQTHVCGEQVAKSVLIKGDTGYRLMVVPSTCKVDLGGISREFGERLGLATEDEICTLFADCDPGAIPTLGQAYGVRVCYDEVLAAQPDVYLEAGDHETLLHISGGEFRRLMATSDHGHYSRHQ